VSLTFNLLLDTL